MSDINAYSKEQFQRFSVDFQIEKKNVTEDPYHFVVYLHSYDEVKRAMNDYEKTINELREKFPKERPRWTIIIKEVI